MTSNFPKVLKKDYGIRPAGKPNECFYCSQKVGEEHKADCVVISKKVKLRLTVEFETTAPHGWTPEDIEFHRNEGTWCTNNVIGELQKHIDSSEKCLCLNGKIDFVEVVDDTPIRAKD